MRVLVVITKAEAGGAQVHVRDLVMGLRNTVDIEVAVGDRGFLTEALAGVVPVHVVPEMIWPIRPVQDVRGLRALAALIRDRRPDVVHTHSTKAGLLGRVAARICGVPAVHTAHAWSFSDGLSWTRKAYAIPLEIAAGRLTERCIVVSEADREVAERYGVVRRSQARIIHNGVPDSDFRAQPGQAGVPVIVTVARLAPPKDYALLLRALSDVRSPYTLRIVGDGPERATIAAMVSELALNANVNFLGTRSDVPAVLAKAHVFTLVSRQEGFPLSILEGMRAGLPVIASDVGGIREALRPETGVLVPRGDRAALAQAFEVLLQDPARRAHLGQAGRHRFEQHFSHPRMCAATRAVYAELA